jgi:hypothetical protein
MPGWTLDGVIEFSGVLLFLPHPNNKREIAMIPVMMMFFIACNAA